MKEKPQKPGKASKKSKAPEIVVELTPKQIKEKKREEARARAAESRKIVTAGTGQWTGKLPAQLLNEHAQKMKWEKVDYPTKPFGREPDQKWVASVVLARRNPKTKEIERVRFDPPPDRVEKQPTQLEARHMAATYGMHRVLSHRNMKMMLPPLHRDLWVQLDEDKAKAKPHEMYKWSEDPWQAEIDRKESRQKFEEERRAREQRREQNEIAREAQRSVQDEAKIHGDKQQEAQLQQSQGGNSQQSDSKSLKNIKFNNALVMSRKARSVVESVIRENNGFRFSTRDALNKSENPERYTKLITMLSKIGFRENYAKEALEYSSSLSAALAWLLIHVPEDDIPQSFMPTDIGATARVSSSIKIENATARLREFGYSEDISRSVANKFEGSLAESVIHLSGVFAEYITSAEKPKEEETDLWNEELESLSSLLDEEQVHISDDGVSCKLKSNTIPIQVTLFKPKNYPHRIPGIAIETTNSSKMSKLTQLEITRQTVIYAKTQLAGDYMVILIFQHIEEIFEGIIKNPPKLAQISSGISGVDEIHRNQSIMEHNQSRYKASTKRAIKFDAKTVIQERDTRMKTIQGKEMLDSRAKLPAWAKRNEIAELVENHQIVLITGETGSGKSTQTVQFILDSIPDAQILCTQPRRISAIGVAQRVAEERLVEIGDQVGYIIRGEAKMSKKTQLRFVTSGVLLRMLQSEAGSAKDDYADMDDVNDSADDTKALSGLHGITHIFVDEVHERSLDGDFLLILLKRLVTKAPKIKVILMSATVDPQQFFSYFKPVKVGYTHITGRTFPVSQHHLGEVITLTGYRPKVGSNQDPDSNYNNDNDEGVEDSVGKIIGEIRKRSPGRVDYNLVAATVEHIHNKLQREGDNNGSILVFLSGAGEIDEALKAIQRTGSSPSLWALPLHASLPPAEQRKVFQKAPRGLRKVVASTNVAETSITISDIVAVIDTGRVKETVYDPEVNVSRLIDTWTSQSSATQRMGRAGRVRAGECFKLYSENTEQTRMPVRPIPEILRSPLEVLYLNVKAMGVSNVEKFLSLAIDPPKQTALDQAKMNLMAYGALDAYNNLTSLGKHISMIPTDPRTAKLLVLGTMMGCLSSCLTVAAVLSLGKLPFVTKRNEDLFNKSVFQNFAGSSGDLIAACKAYNEWRTNSADKAKVNQGACRDIRSTRKQLLSSLVQIGFVDSNITTSNDGENLPPSLSKYDNDEASVRAVVSASLRPNIAEIVFPQQKYMSTSSGAIQKDGVDDARQIKYFKSTGERVFVHPRSLMFGTTDFIDGARYVSYGSAILTSKHFIAEVTPLSTYGLILFSGRIDVDPLGNGIIIDKWTGLKCWPRAGILLQFLQQLLSILMERKFRDPSVNFIDHPVIELVHDLIESDGRAQPVGLVS